MVKQRTVRAHGAMHGVGCGLLLLGCWFGCKVLDRALGRRVDAPQAVAARGSKGAVQLAEPRGA